MNVHKQATGQMKAAEPSHMKGAKEAGPDGAKRSPLPNQAQVQQLEAVRKSISFTQIVSLLMRSPLHKTSTLEDLNWLLLPALQRGQFKIAEAKVQPEGMSVPAGFVLWARVSADVDKRLSESLGGPLKLTADEWTSGDIIWLIETVGDPRALKELLKSFRDGLTNGRDVKLRVTSPEGKVAISTLGALRLDEAAAPPAGAA